MDPRAIAILLLGIIFAIAGVFDYVLSSSGIGDTLSNFFSDFQTAPSGLFSKITALISGYGGEIKTVSIEAELTFDTTPMVQISFEEPAYLSLVLKDERINLIKVGPTKKGMLDLTLEEGEVNLRDFYGSLSLSETVELEGSLSSLTLPDGATLSNQPGKMYMVGYGLKIREVRIMNSSVKELYLPPTSGTVFLNDRTIKCTLEGNAISLPRFTGEIVFDGDSIRLEGAAKIRAIDAICGG